MGAARAVVELPALALLHHLDAVNARDPFERVDCNQDVSHERVDLVRSEALLGVLEHRWLAQEHELAVVRHVALGANVGEICRGDDQLLRLLAIRSLDRDLVRVDVQDVPLGVQVGPGVRVRVRVRSG